jgi:hypothetical protein
MVAIKFPDVETLKKALGFLVTRFSGRALRGGTVIVPEIALKALKAEGFDYRVTDRNPPPPPRVRRVGPTRVE